MYRHVQQRRSLKERFQASDHFPIFVIVRGMYHRLKWKKPRKIWAGWKPEERRDVVKCKEEILNKWIEERDSIVVAMMMTVDLADCHGSIRTYVLHGVGSVYTQSDRLTSQSLLIHLCRLSCTSCCPQPEAWGHRETELRSYDCKSPWL